MNEMPPNNSDKTPANDENNEQMQRANVIQIERAIDDAETLIAYAARAGIVIDKETFDTLFHIRAKWDAREWSNECALDFWEAFRKINELIKPATAESVRAITLEPSHSGIRGFFQNQYGRSEGARAITRYTLWTLFVLAIVLVIQIYWVIGNSLANKVTDLFALENEMSTALYQANLDHSELEVLFKLKEEEDAERLEEANYEFYNSSDWERETLQLSRERQRMEEELAALSTQLARNFHIMEWWASRWFRLILQFKKIDNVAIDNQMLALESELKNEETLLKELLAKEGLPKQISENEDKLAGLDEQLLALEAQMSDLISEQGDQLATGNGSGEDGLVTAKDAVQQAIRDQIDQTHAARIETEKWLEQNDLEIVRSDKESKLARLQTELDALKKQQERWLVREEGRRLVLSAEFMLVVLQSYVLPVLYGLLGASVYVLRSIMRSISEATYYPDRSYLLRLALGTLSGLIIGWFVFLLPGQSFLSSLSPMALAFIVGYNIEIIFALMDKVIDNFTSGKSEEEAEEKKNKTKPDDDKKGSGSGQSGSQSTETKPA